MTSKLDLGAVIIGASAAVIAAAVIAGFIVVGGPGSARALRIDDLRMTEIINIASAAQCAYSVTHSAPADLQAIETALAPLRTSDGPCQSVNFDARAPHKTSYEPVGADKIKLCTNFLRPSPPAAPQRPELANLHAMAGAPFNFPELQEPRAEAGRHCFQVHLAALPKDGNAAP